MCNACPDYLIGSVPSVRNYFITNDNGEYVSATWEEFYNEIQTRKVLESK